MDTKIIGLGQAVIETKGNEWALEGVPVPGMKSTDRVFLTTAVTNGGSGPKTKGPLYCAFVDEKRDNGFDCLVYDIQANPFNVTILVDWLVVGVR